MKRQLFLLPILCLLAVNISQAQEKDYIKLGNECFEKGDYECAKSYYNVHKLQVVAATMDEKIDQCDKSIGILTVANFLFADKDYQRAKEKYEELLTLNPKDPHALKQIELCNVVINQPNYLQLGNDCFDRGDYNCAKRNYEAQKQNVSSAGMDEKMKQCDNSISILTVADFLFSEKDYVRAKGKYEELLALNPIDPNAKQQILLCNSAINQTSDVANNQPTASSSSTASKTLQDVKLLHIKGGTFTMGSPVSEQWRSNDETQHNVTLSDFYLSEKEITNEQYCKFLNAKKIPKNGKGDVEGHGNQLLVEAHGYGVVYGKDAWQPAPGKSYYPVILVTWFGAKAYCDWAGGRLPTEAEWEYACRAGTTTPFYTGDNITTSQANFNGKYAYSGKAKGKFQTGIRPVGSYPPNAWGLYDMHGNVWEWCNDWYDGYSSDAATNPQGPSSGTQRVRRGGCYFNGAGNCRSASRNKFGAIGLRMAATF